MLASNGMRTAPRFASQAASHGRSIHIPSFTLGRKPPLPPGGVSSSKGKGVIDFARSAFTRLLYGTNPSLTPKPQAFRRAIHTVQPIRNQFSFPVRHALTTSPLSFARPPMVQRGMTEVGLGTARKFSTARPIFQHLVQNVPVAGRTMYEMDLDLEKKRARKLASKRRKQEKKAEATREKAKASQSSLKESFDKYFPARAVDGEEVSTILTVPLEPFDAPGPLTPECAKYYDQSFLPFHEATKTFQTHGKHSRRVSALFIKLDQARVWDRGAHYEAFGPMSSGIDSYPPHSVLCTSLRIVFDGWNAEMVRSLIGEVGLGWCTLQESRIRSSTVHVGPYSLESSRAQTPAPAIPTSSNIWAETPEFIMPSIDFSSSFLDQAELQSPSRESLRLEDIGILNSGSSTPWMSDNLSLPSTRPGSAFGDHEVEDEWHTAPGSLGHPPQRNEAAFAFSAEFMRRSQDMDVWSNF
jgi:hypothetical protein